MDDESDEIAYSPINITFNEVFDYYGDFTTYIVMFVVIVIVILILYHYRRRQNRERSLLDFEGGSDARNLPTIGATATEESKPKKDKKYENLQEEV